MLEWQLWPWRPHRHGLKALGIIPSVRTPDKTIVRIRAKVVLPGALVPPTTPVDRPCMLMTMGTTIFHITRGTIAIKLDIILGTVTTDERRLRRLTMSAQPVAEFARPSRIDR